MLKSSPTLPLFSLKMAAVLFILCSLVVTGVTYIGHLLHAKLLTYTVADLDNYQLHLYAVDIDRRLNVHILTLGSAGAPAAWSPDGNYFATDATVPSAERPGYPLTYGIYIVGMNTGTTKLVRIRGAELDWLSTFTWSPNGDRLAYTLYVDNARSIWTMDIDGNHHQQLTDGQLNARYPVWSPDGTFIAYLGYPEYMNARLYVMQVDGDENRVLSGTLQNIVSPVWSPDGQQLAFVVDTIEAGFLYVMNVNGGSPQLLTENINFLGGLAWSPDSRQIVYLSSLRPSDLYVINVDGGQEQRLTNNMDGAVQPIWSPDGQEIAFIYDRDIFLINADGSNLRQVTYNTQSESILRTFVKPPNPTT